ncbi:YcxB family protein [Streptomyces sp. NPDC004059]
MVMDMGRDAVMETVELDYRPTARDFSSALWARRKVTWSVRHLVGAVAVGVLCYALLASDGDIDLPTLLLLCYLALGLVLLPRLQGRGMMRAADVNGPCRTTVTDTGVTIRGEHITVTQGWGARPVYRETPELFVLFSDGKKARCLTLLPKHGLSDPSDADRLRAILDRHLTRV